MKKGFHVFFVFMLIAVFAAIANAGQVTLQTGDDGQYINMPVTGTDTLVIPSGVTSFKVYDDGLGEDDNGNLGNYSNGANGYLVLRAPAGNLLKITGSLNTESGCDYLYVYDGDVGSDILLNGESGVYNLDELSSTNAFATLYFHSDVSVTNSGLELTISLIEASTQHTISLNSVSGGSISSDKLTAKVGETVTLSLTPGENKMSNGVTVVAEGGEPVSVFGGIWYSGNTATFVMPNNNVEVTPSFVGEDGKYINMPASGTKDITISLEDISFKVYDDGGVDGDYSNYARGYLVLRAPEGFSLMLSGTMNSEQKYDSFAIYDGNSDGYPLFGITSGENVTVGPVVSSGNVVTLYFYSDGGGTYSGLDLTVSVIDASTPHAISVNNAVGGSVNSDKETALVGELVTLTLTPDENKFISGVSVADEDGKPVEVTGGKWYSGNTATFVMPVSNVTVNAAFVESITAEGGAFINMPVSGTETIAIPAGVTSFKVYDDGGKDGNHNYNADGYLELFAPAGYSLAVSGTVNSSDGCGYVTVYDGVSANYIILDEKTGLNEEVGPVVSTENVMTIRFYSSYCSVEAGLDLTVTLIDKTAPHAIALNSVEGGNVSSDKLSAAMGETVTLTLAPNENKLISGASVVGADGTPIEVIGGNWYSGNTATFVMPFQNVEVTATFVDAITAEGGAFINMPASGEEYITIPAGVTSFKVYDDGGKDGEYSNRVKGALSFVAPEGMQLMVSGTMNTEGCDGLTILDGEYGYETLFGTTGGEQDIDPVVSTLGGLMIRFESDVSVVYSGLDLTVTVVDMNTEYAVTVNSAPGGTVTSNVSSAKVGDEIALSITLNKGYLLSGLEVKGTENQQLIKVNGGEWYSDNDEIRFKMPRENVTVTPVFTNDLTAEGGLGVDIHNGDKQYVYIPEGVRSFRVKYNDYVNYASTNLSLYAPEGYVFRVEDLEDNVSAKYFQIIDYSEYGDNCIWGYWCGNVSPSVSSYSDNLMMRVYAQEEEFTLDMKVTLVDATKSHAVNVATGIQGGSVQSETSTAMLGEYVNLTVSPNEGFLLASIDVIDSVGNAVKVDNGFWYSEGTAYFKMPAYYVTVTPTFTNDFSNLSINMPTYGSTVEANIPASVTSFKVYDDGGADKDYTPSGANTIVLNAPDGYVFRVTGEVSLMSNDYLSIYDGDLSGDVLLRRFTGYGASVGSIISTGPKMTLYFNADGGNVSEGLDLTVELVDATAPHLITIASSIRGTVTSDVTSASVGQTVTLTAVPNSPYMLMEISVSDENGNSRKVEGGTWCTSNTATFTMPYADVNVSATYTNLLTATGGLYVNMPSSGTKTINVPEGVQSFKVYDDGGANAISSEGANGLLEMRAPLGYKFEVSGTVRGSTSASITFTVYDGDNQTDAVWERGVNYYSGAVNVSVSGTGNIMTLDFDGQNGKGSGGLANLDLTISLVQAQSHAVALGDYDVNGGTASVDKTTAYPGETVTLTTHSATGYVLTGVSVVNSESNPVKTSATSWNTDNTVTFVMPNDGVTVTPQFTNNLTAEGGLYIRMPAGGNSMRFTVPEVVTSFKLYAADVDDNHCRSMYGGDNIIELASADGRGFLVEGSISSNSNLRIYDGQMEWMQPPPQDRHYSGNESTDIGQYQSTGDTITISYNRCEDLDLKVTIGGVATKYTITLVNATGGSVYSDKDEALAGERIRLVFDNDNTHVLEGVRIEDAGGNSVVDVNAAWYTDEDVYFTMPSTNVTVIPEFTDKLTAEDGLFINMPSNEWNDLYASIPGNVKSFKIYDDGGSDGNYTTPANGEITMYAPAGYAFKLTGSMTASADGRLSIEVGNNGDYSTQEIASAGEGLATDIGTITGDYMELDFRGCDNDKECYGAQTYSGLDLTVTLVKSVHYAAVSVSEDENGRMVATIDGNYNDYDEIDIPSDIPVESVVFNRTFSTSGFSTIMLPFDVTAGNIEGARSVIAFDGMVLNEATGDSAISMRYVWCNSDVVTAAAAKGENLTCNSDEAELSAYTPYMVEMESATLTFNGAQTLKQTPASAEARVKGWVFRATLQKKDWESSDEEIQGGRVWAFAAQERDGAKIGKYVRLGPGATTRPLRAYLVSDPQAPTQARGLFARSSARNEASVLPETIDVVIVNHDENGEEHTTVIGKFDTRTGEMRLDRNARTFDLNGRNVGGRVNAKGMYLKK